MKGLGHVSKKKAVGFLFAFFDPCAESAQIISLLYGKEIYGQRKRTRFTGVGDVNSLSVCLHLNLSLPLSFPFLIR